MLTLSLSSGRTATTDSSTVPPHAQGQFWRKRSIDLGPIERNRPRNNDNNKLGSPRRMPRKQFHTVPRYIKCDAKRERAHGRQWTPGCPLGGPRTDDILDSGGINVQTGVLERCASGCSPSVGLHANSKARESHGAQWATLARCPASAAQR